MINCTVLIMTFNESRNIKKCLDSVAGKFERVCVVDSFSTDHTIEIIKSFEDVEIYFNKFDSWGTQRNWIFNESNVQSDYVMFLDADEIISESLRCELTEYMQIAKMDNARFSVKNIFMGKWIKYSYGHPSIVRIFKTNSAPEYRAEGAREYPRINGNQVFLKNALIHCDNKPIEEWFLKHISNAKREASYLTEERTASNNESSLKSFIRNNIWIYLPIFFRPLIYFLYRYIIKGGFLDGHAGFIYCFFQAYSYQNMISTFIYEKEIIIKKNLK